MSYQSLAIILRKIDWGEDSQLFYFYTQRYGKVVALGRATKKIQSKLNSHLQLFSIIDLSFVRGKTFDHIVGAQMTEAFFELKNNYQGIIYGSVALELVDQLTTVADPESEIFDLLIDYFATLEKPGNNLDQIWPVIKQRFIVRLLSICGYQPNDKIISDAKKLTNFLNSHLNQELKTQNFIKS